MTMDPFHQKIQEAGEELREVASNFRMTFREKGFHHLSQELSDICNQLYKAEADWSHAIAAHSTPHQERHVQSEIPKIFLTKWGGGIAVAFRIGNQTFTLDRVEDEETPELNSANWQANMLRSAFGQERRTVEEDPLLSMFDNNEPIN